METIFGSTAPVWTATPSTAFPFQSPLAIGARAVAPAFGAPTMPMIPGGLAAPAPLGTGAAIPLASAAPLVSPLFVQEGPATVTPSALLAAIALRRGQPQGPSNDAEVEDFIYEAFELLPGATEVDVRCEAGRVTLSGTVLHKRVKRDVGEIVWAIPALQDVQNNVTISPRRRGRRGEAEPQSNPTRKQGANQ